MGAPARVKRNDAYSRIAGVMRDEGNGGIIGRDAPVLNHVRLPRSPSQLAPFPLYRVERVVDEGFPLFAEQYTARTRKQRALHFFERAAGGDLLGLAALCRDAKEPVLRR